jgi:ADP-ribosylglycohydrolase
MLGAVIGDILGSLYEGGSTESRTVPLFGMNDTPTDDSVCTLAIAEAVLREIPPATARYARSLRDWGHAFPDAGYGRDFKLWLSSAQQAPYGSYGNGALMRVSGAIALSRSLPEARARAHAATAVTHDHEVSLTSVDLYTRALWSAIEGHDRDTICVLLESNGVMPHDVDVAHRRNEFHIRADETLADALSCLSNATDFESLMRECRYHGGDTDTLCAVAGPLGEVLWGIPSEIVEHAWPLLPTRMQNTLVEEYEALASIHPHIWGLPEGA